MTTLDKILWDVRNEYERATTLSGPFASHHEGYAIILEEMDELWDEIKKKSRDRDPEKLREEAIQVAAMAVRFIFDAVEPL